MVTGCHKFVNGCIQEGVYGDGWLFDRLEHGIQHLPSLLLTLIQVYISPTKLYVFVVPAQLEQS